MRIGLVLLLGCLFALADQSCEAQKITGQVVDPGGKPLPFATIKFGNTRNGRVADLDGKFSFTLKNEINFLEISYLNYETKKITVSATDTFLLVQLLPATGSLDEVVIRSNSNKLTRILKSAVAHRQENNPDRYPWYQCNIYYKWTVDLNVQTGGLIKDSGRKKDLEEELAAQHLFMSETYSKRTWQQPQRLQEDVMATKMSGLKKAIAPTLVTDILPFHAYTDYITLNQTDYYNPVAPGLFQRFRYQLNDEILQDKDTLWVISFEPVKKENELRGTVYISSNNFAIAHISAHSIDTVLKRDIGIEQQYRFTNGKWFPQQLNYIMTGKMTFPPVSVLMKGTSIIDSVSFIPDENFHFDRAHTVKMVNDADEKNDSTWLKIRPVPLEPIEVRTYAFVDSLAELLGLQKIVNMGKKMGEGKLSFGKFDVNLQRLYSYNSYEKSRLGFGLQTNERLWKHFSLGAWAGYGMGDKNWKYGGFGEIYIDPPIKEFVIRADYYNDLRIPGQSQVQTGIDFTSLRHYEINAIDKVKGWNLTVTKKFGYLSTAVNFSKEQLTPKYAYEFFSKGKTYKQFNIREAGLNLRYAFGERTALLFGRYYNSTDSKFPVLYVRINYGKIKDPEIPYTQITAALNWQRHLNRIGDENILIVGARSFSPDPLPLQKLFAGSSFTTGAYLFGNMQTMPAGQFYSDRYINLFWLHTFDWRFYTLNLLKKKLSSIPTPAIGYNMLWGSMQHKEAHQLIDFFVPDPAYHEAGFLINNILRVKFLGLGYLGLNLGYFHQLSNKPEARNNGRFVIGILLQ
ncbi:MAG: hypothetical protein JWN76_2297 [Chitinophagaceae bacterium]|nr:hypothetical protein [Chitinophagaceae bacterium]